MSHRQTFSRTNLHQNKPGRKPRARFNAMEALENRRLLSSAIFTVTNADDAGTGSFRWAIEQANVDSGQDTIKFAIDGTGVHTINVASQLPTLNFPVLIDGTSQPGYTAGAAPVIQLNGATAGASIDGLDIVGGHSTVQGLAINNFTGAGIAIFGLGGDTVVNNYVGIDPSGAPAGNAEGVTVQSDANFIGLPGGMNVISGNSRNGVRVAGRSLTVPANGNSISNNFIGTDVSGATAIGNAVGIYLDVVSNTLVNANVISGNNGDGLSIHNSTGNPNTVQANRIGVDPLGTAALGNARHGITIINSDGFHIGGSGANGNVISSNNADGIRLTGAANVTIDGNKIGTDATGSVNLGNAGNGVMLSTGSHDNTIGGITPDLRNIIDGGDGDGVQVFTGSTAVPNLIVGNFIGTDESGTLALGGSSSGSGNGITINSPGSTLTGNLVSGNSSGDGIYLAAAATVQRNLIGVKSDGISRLPNLNDGIYIASSGSLIGGAPEFGNVIAYNAFNGINVSSGTMNSIRANSIYANGTLGIDVNNDGVTPNGLANTPGIGANNLLNHPVLTNAVISATATTVSGTYTGLASTTYTVELFISAAPTASDGSGQGKTYLGTVTVTTDSTGNGTFSATLGVLPAGQPITSTATDGPGNTSEFSSTVLTGVSTPIVLPTSTSLSTLTPSVVVGTPVTFTATVMLPPGPPAIGTVTFEEVSGTNITTLGLPMNFTGASVSITLSTLSVGTHNIIAVYSGDANYATSTSSPLTETIKSNTITISGTTFRDTTGDGLSGDDGALSGVTVKLFRDVNNNFALDGGDGAAVAQAVTAADGSYSFGNLPIGRYFVQETTPTGFIRTAPAFSSYYTVNSTAGMLYSGNDFDNYMMCNDRQWVSGIAFNINGGNTWIPDLRGHIHEGDTVKVRFSVATGHTATLTLVSYTAPGSSFDANKASLQSVYQFATGTFSPGAHTMQVTIPLSYFQVDFVCGDYIDHFGPAGSNVFYSAQKRLISADNGGIHAQLMTLLASQNNSVLNT